MFFPLTQKSFLCKQTFGKTHEIHNFTRLKLEVEMIQTGTFILTRYLGFSLRQQMLKLCRKTMYMVGNHGVLRICYLSLFVLFMCIHKKTVFRLLPI